MRHELLTDKDVADAERALIEWFRSQGISMPNSMIVMGNTMVSGLLIMSAIGQGDPLEGLEALIHGLREQLMAQLEP